MFCSVVGQKAGRNRAPAREVRQVRPHIPVGARAPDRVARGTAILQEEADAGAVGHRCGLGLCSDVLLELVGSHHDHAKPHLRVSHPAEFSAGAVEDAEPLSARE